MQLNLNFEETTKKMDFNRQHHG